MWLYFISSCPTFYLSFISYSLLFSNILLFCFSPCNFILFVTLTFLILIILSAFLSQSLTVSGWKSLWITIACKKDASFIEIWFDLILPLILPSESHSLQLPVSHFHRGCYYNHLECRWRCDYLSVHCQFRLHHQIRFCPSRWFLCSNCHWFHCLACNCHQQGNVNRHFYCQPN